MISDSITAAPRRAAPQALAKIGPPAHSTGTDSAKLNARQPAHGIGGHPLPRKEVGIKNGSWNMLTLTAKMAATTARTKSARRARRCGLSALPPSFVYGSALYPRRLMVATNASGATFAGLYAILTMSDAKVDPAALDALHLPQRMFNQPRARRAPHPADLKRRFPRRI